MRQYIKHTLSLALLFLLFSSKASSQSNGVDVRNNSPCNVYFQLLGGRAPGCDITEVSDVFVFVPSQIQNFPDPTTVPIPGLSATDYILGVLIHDRDMCACGPTVTYVMIGDPCTSMPGGTSYTGLNAGCNACGTINVTWTPGTPIATLVFN